MSMPKLALIALSKTYGSEAAPAVDALDLVVEPGQTLALLGPSGCGKSTTLNMIAGLEAPTSGDIRVDGKSVLGMPPGRRPIGLVFQDYAVFTHMSVAQNLAFGLSVRGVSAKETALAVGEVAELLNLSDRLGARARDLGGSELQRVAIGRTLVTRPSILLLDEPLSNLEAAARLAMRRELRRLQREVGLTIVYVTHDQIEALSLADRIAVMSEGRLRQSELTSEIYDRPGHTFVASFLGSPPMNLLPGELVPRGLGVVFENAQSSVVLPEGAAAVTAGRARVLLGVRPEALRLAPPDEASTWVGRVVLVEPRGSEAVVTVESGAGSLKVLTAARDRPEEGTLVGVWMDAQRCVVFDERSGQRLAA